MTRTQKSLLIVLLASGIAACAPDAVRPNSAFDAWLDGVKQACGYQTIGSYQVGSLLSLMAAGSSDADNAVYFLDQTSRLYAGRIDAAQWTQGVTAFLNGRPGDPGVSCVLARLPPR
jgi:hypothetical protein